MDSLEEKDKFLETYKLPRLNQEEIDNVSRLISNSEIEFVISKKKNQTKTNKKLPAHKNPGLSGFTGEFYQTYKEEIIPIFLKLFQKIEEKGIPLTSF